MGTTTPHADVEGTAVDLPDEPDGGSQQVGTALVPRTRRSEVIRPLNADQLAESFAEYQALLPRLLVESDYQQAEADKKFVKKSGWRKIGAAFDLDVTIIAEDVERDENGRILRSKTTARATSPSGRVMDGDGYCTIDEFTGRRAGNPKLENDLRGTAATRAKNRAISDLVGMGEVSAEEVNPGGGAQATELPAWAAPVDADGIARVRKALAFLLDDTEDGQWVEDAGARITRAAGGLFPVIAMEAVVQVATVLKRHQEQPPTPAGEPAADAARVAAQEHSDFGSGESPAGEQATLDGSPPPATGTSKAPAGTVEAPEQGDTHPVTYIANLRKLGCSCSNPLAADGRSDVCVIKGHGIPF